MNNEKVTEEMPCTKCGEWIPSDGELWVKHVIAKHDVPYGTFAHNIARMYTDFSRTRPIAAAKKER